MNTQLTIKQNLNGFSLSFTGIKYRSKYLSHKIYDKKLKNSISRTKSVLFDYLKNNQFDFFVTLTVNDKHNRSDLVNLKKIINDRIKYMRKKGFSDLRYILIPEKHKNRKLALSWLFQWGIWC